MEQHHLCPVWVGYLSLIPLRKLRHNPQKILGPYIKSGMTVMDYGCAMGFFSIPMARLVGEGGTVYCVDIQPEMLERLKKRAEKHGVSNIIRPLLVNSDYNPAELSGKLDFVMLFYVVHEVAEKKQLFADLAMMLKRGGKILFVEPEGHVTSDEFEESLRLAAEAGLELTDDKPVRNKLSAILIKK